MLIIIPVGTSYGEKITLVNKSHKTTKTAPNKHEKGKLIRWFPPTIFLDICGTINPTKPSIPAYAITLDANKRDRIIKINVYNLTLTPKD